MLTVSFSQSSYIVEEGEVNVVLVYIMGDYSDDFSVDVDITTSLGTASEGI